MKIRVINQSSNPLPSYATESSAGMDLRAFLEETVTILPMERALIPTGLYMELPAGHEAQIRPRSGLALKAGITVLNSHGTIDADYRGEIKVLLVTLSANEFTINSGDRIAQLISSRHEPDLGYEAAALSDTVRALAGYVHKGVRCST